MQISSEDWAMRSAAFRQVRRLRETRDQLTAADLNGGFQFDGTRIPLMNPQRGIFKPRQMEALLSIKTVFPKAGAKIWYDDQREVHKKIFEGTEVVEYSFMGNDPNAADNTWLRIAMERQVPIIYFIGVSPGRYEAVVPSFIVGWNPNTCRAQVAFSNPELTTLPKPPRDGQERRYALRIVQQRLHQASFRDAVIQAYDGRCAISGLPEPLLLDAAHIVPDRDEALGHAVVPNGVPLTKLHHAAFDSNLIGIDADLRIHVSHRLLRQNDGPVLEAMKSLHGSKLRLPARPQDHPDRERLILRFQEFREHR